ncbi:MAG: DUF1573 domain-containing protein [Runella slithyformis]|nr:MAG: DUF1573 domain-containing protein [Runella slithyformis]
MSYLKSFLWVCLAVGLACCGSNQDKAATASSLSDKMPKIVFEDSVKNVDFGALVEGDTVQRNFKFSNAGEFPLIINNVSTSCGCTVPQWPRDPIAPGESASIVVKFNSRGKVGSQAKAVSIYANTDPAVTEITFRAEVAPKTGL